MSNALKTALGVVGIVIATQAAAQVTLYSREDFRGESFTADRDIQNMESAMRDNINPHLSEPRCPCFHRLAMN